MTSLLQSRSIAPTRPLRTLASALVLAIASLGLTAVALPAAAAEDVPLDDTESFSSDIEQTHMGLAFDGTSYWEVSGGTTGGVRLAHRDSNGDLIAQYQPGHDFRAVSAGPDGTIYTSDFASNVVSTVSSSGTVTPFVTLAGPVPAQGTITINEAGDRFITQQSGTVLLWNLDGTPAETVTLEGWRSTDSFGNDAVRIAQTAGMFLVPDAASQRVVAWDASGARVGSFALAGVDFNDYIAGYSFSASDGAFHVFSGNEWRVFPISFALVATDATFVAGEDITATASVFNNGVDLTGETVTFSVYEGDVCTGEPMATTTGTVADGEAAAAAISVTAAGEYQWVAAVGGLSSSCGAAPFTVTPAALDTLEISPVTAQIAFDASQEYTATGADAFGNPIAEPGGVTYTVDGGTCTDNVCSAEPGTHTVTATAGDVVATATLVVNPEAPAVVTSPADNEVLTGGDATFTVVASGGDAAVQWQSSTDGETWVDIDGATKTTLTIGAVNPQMDGISYRAVLTNSTGTATSEPALLTVPPVGLALTDASGASVMAGDTIVEGDSVTAEVDSLAPDTTVTMTLESEPTVVGTPTSGASGVASATFDVPTIGAGAHTFVVTDSSGAVLATLALMVEAAAVPEVPDSSDEAAPPAEEDELSQTGADVLPALAIALATAIAGAMLVLTGRRRTHA